MTFSMCLNQQRCFLKDRTILTALLSLYSAVGTMTPTTAGTMGGGTAGTSTGTGTGTAGAGMGTGTATGTAGTGFGGLGPGTDASMDTAAAAGLLLPTRAGGLALATALVALLLSAMVLA